MKFIIIFGVILFLFSVVMCHSHSKPLRKNYGNLARAITAKTAKKLKEEKNLILVGTGGQMMHDIQVMIMEFEFFNVVDIETARRLLVYSVEEYLSVINSSKEIRPYLHNYPFTAKNVEIAIYLRNPDGSRVALDKIKIAAAYQGKVTYYVDYPEKQTIKIVCEETYEEALKVVSSK